MKTWKDKIDKWLNGKYQKYPKNIKKRFFYETNCCYNNLLNIYKDNFIESDKLEQINKQDYSLFIDYINNSNNKYVTSFYNLSKDTKLIIPIPRKNKDYTTIKDFMDNASRNQQKEFWRYVANEINELLKIHNKIYVSSHGLGVYYFHLRLCTYPKYYHTEEFR